MISIRLRILLIFSSLPGKNDKIDAISFISFTFAKESPYGFAEVFMKDAMTRIIDDTYRTIGTEAETVLRLALVKSFRHSSGSNEIRLLSLALNQCRMISKLINCIVLCFYVYIKEGYIFYLHINNRSRT
jgi:hypothetical protein